jgi:hypothetical protein
MQHRENTGIMRLPAIPAITPTLRMKFVIPRLTLYNPHFVTYITSNADFLHGSRGFFHTKVMPVAGRRKAQMPR